MEFRTYRESDYEAVCAFLIALNETDRTHIHWNWARFEWMYGHPECDTTLLGSIGLWFDHDMIVGAAIYDMYFGEAFCAALSDYASLYPEILSYAYDALRDESGLAVAIADDCKAEIAQAKALGFAPIEQTETVLAIDLDRPFTAVLPDGLRLYEPDPIRDEKALQWLFWQGFDHGSDRAEFEADFEKTAQELKPRRHFDPALSLAARSPAGELISYCCLWVRPGTGYAYVEPVCTVPAWRGCGIAGALLQEAFRRAKARGAEKAFVISDLAFYENLGFRKKYHYTFYWKA